MSFGCSHITTLDGVSYDYNGQGEYWYISSPLLSVQVRTIPALRSDGTNASAVVFGAFAIQVPSTGLIPSDRIHVEMDSTRQSKFTFCFNKIYL